MNSVDLELKEFEKKINNITEQFMSLLDSTETSECSVNTKIEETPVNFESGITGPTVYNTGYEDFESISSTRNVNKYNVTGVSDSIFSLNTDTVNFGGIAYNTGNTAGVPKHAIRFDSGEQIILDKKLEDLYNERKSVMSTLSEKPNLAFSDSNMNRNNEYRTGTTHSGYEGTNYVGGTKYNESTVKYNDYTNNVSSNTSTSYENYYDDTKYEKSVGYTNEETNSTLNNKEVYEMASYNGEGNNGGVFSSFATIPAERALVEKKTWKETLFMDIPWDTKIDIWGAIKTFCSAQVKITF